MRQTIHGAVLGALVAAGVSVLLAQSATWTSPRTWATDDLLTAADFNAQFRDNLLWLRQDAQLTGTDALEDLGCGTLGTNEVLFSDCSWAALPAGTVFDIHDDLSLATIADADRLAFSDESLNGDPMRSTLASSLADYMQVEVELDASRVTGGSFNTARIPNLAAAKTTSGTFNASRIPDISAAKLTSGTLPNARLSNIPTNSLANDAVTQAKIADAAVGVMQLKLGAGSQAVTVVSGDKIDVLFDIARYAYLPRLAPSSGSPDCTIGLGDANSSTTITTSRAVIRIRNANIGDACTAKWDYVTSSDMPSVWALVQDSDGVVVGLFEAEDPVSIGDTVAPMSSPLDANDNPLPGYTAVNVGLPALSVIEALYATLTADQRTAALSSTADYVMGRGWFYNLTSLSQLASIPARYEPSGRQWAMRCAANAAVGVSGCHDAPVTGFYLDNLVVDAGVWAVAP